MRELAVADGAGGLWGGYKALIYAKPNIKALCSLVLGARSDAIY
jgi:hypothetical protein